MTSLSRTVVARTTTACLFAIAALVALLVTSTATAHAQEDGSAEDVDPLALVGAELQVVTVPPIPGAEFRLLDMVAVAGDDGVATFPDSISRRYLGTAELLVEQPTVMLPDGSRAEFSRLLQLQSFTQPVIAAFDIFYEVSFRYADSRGQPIDAADLDVLVLRSSIGEGLEQDPAADVWLQGQRVVPNLGELEPKTILWNIDDVQVDGASVVNRAQQRFEPAIDPPEVDVDLLFFGADITSSDGLFGFPVGDGIRLLFPDGSERTYAFDENHELQLESLPRGEYRVAVVGPGPTIFRPLALSRNQDITLQLYTWVDIAVFVAALLFFSVGLIGLGLRREGRVGSARRVGTAQPATTVPNGTRVRTVPPVEGVRTLVNGQLVRTGADGQAVVEGDVDRAALTIEVLDPTSFPNPHQRATLLGIGEAGADILLRMAVETLGVIHRPTDSQSIVTAPQTVSGGLTRSDDSGDLLVLEVWEMTVRWEQCDGPTDGWKLVAEPVGDPLPDDPVVTLRHPNGRSEIVEPDQDGRYVAFARTAGRYQLSWTAVDTVLDIREATSQLRVITLDQAELLEIR